MKSSESVLLEKATHIRIFTCAPCGSCVACGSCAPCESCAPYAPCAPCGSYAPCETYVPYGQQGASYISSCDFLQGSFQNSLQQNRQILRLLIQAGISINEMSLVAIYCQINRPAQIPRPTTHDPLRRFIRENLRVV